MENTATERPATLLIDGTCRFCVAGAKRLTSVARRGSLDVVDFHAPGVLERFPRVTAGMCRGAMQLVLPGGEVHSGAGALAEVLATRKWLRWVRWVYRVRPVRWMADRLYGIVGRNRHRIMGRTGEGCERGACRGGR